MQYTCYHCDKDFVALNETDVEALKAQQTDVPMAVVCTECHETCNVVFKGECLSRDMGAEGGKYIIGE